MHQKLLPHFGIRFWAVTLPLHTTCLVFFLEEDKAYFTCKATATNSPFSLVCLGSTVQRDWAATGAALELRIPCARESRTENPTFERHANLLHPTILTRDCAERERGPKLKPSLQYCLKQTWNFFGKKNPALWLLSSPRQAYQITFGHIWVSTSLKTKGSHNSGRNRDAGAKPALEYDFHNRHRCLFWVCTTPATELSLSITGFIIEWQRNNIIKY